MARSRTEILLIGLTILALSAGVVAGMLVSRLPTPVPADQGPERTQLEQELGLTPQQRDQMRDIWENVRRNGHQAFKDAQQLSQQRDDALVGLLTDEQKVKFEKISKDFAQRFAQLEQTRENAFSEAVNKTKSLLSETQRQKYDEILKQHVGPRPPLGGFPGSATHGPATSPLP